MTQTVVVISIGPVQGFIAAARRMRDFAYGSRLLVELARVTARELKKRKFEVIFPADPDKDAPNKLVALYRSDAKDIPVRMNEIHVEVNQFLQHTMQTVIDKFNNVSIPLTDESKKRAHAQIKDILEFYWAFASKPTYRDALESAELALAARKSLRNAGAFPMGAALPKSSLTGHYESILPEENYNLVGSRAKKFRYTYGVRNAERISGIDFLKRHGSFAGLRTKFTSVALMAARGALQRAGKRTRHVTTKLWQTDAQFNESWRSIDAELSYYDSEERTDGVSFDQSDYAECLFESRVAEVVDNPQDMKNVVRSLNRLLSDHGIKTDKPYYALLLADGDRMGKVISACTSAATDESLHKQFSQALSQFADQVKAVVSQHDGEAIYTGGDDVLAILPVMTAVSCANEIQQLFAQKLQPVFGNIKHKLDDETKNAGLSVSIGVAIVHHMEPLADALDIVRKAEKAAKKWRSALAITVSKRSGSDITVSGQWQSGFVQRINDITQMLRREQLPDGYAYEIRELMSRLYPDVTLRPVGTDFATLSHVLMLEEQRILKRKKDAQGERVNVDAINAIRQTIAMNYGEFAHVSEWVNEIIVARELM